MRSLLFKWSLLFLFLPGIAVAAQAPVVTAKSGTLHVHMGRKVLYCAARISVARKIFLATMKDGIAMSTKWHFKISRVRSYWFNENTANITVTRHAKPDLLTRRWLLTDASSGISRRVYRIKDAIQFLSGLNDFPLLDRSLLRLETPYRISVSVEIHSEGINAAWWTSLWYPKATAMQLDFSLP